MQYTNKLNLRFTYKPEEDEEIDRELLAERLGEEMISELEDLMLCP